MHDPRHGSAAYQSIGQVAMCNAAADTVIKPRSFPWSIKALQGMNAQASRLIEASRRLDCALGGEQSRKGSQTGENKAEGPSPVLSLREEIAVAVEALSRRMSELEVMLTSVEQAIG